MKVPWLRMAPGADISLGIAGGVKSGLDAEFGVDGGAAWAGLEMITCGVLDALPDACGVTVPTLGLV